MFVKLKVLFFLVGFLLEAYSNILIMRKRDVVHEVAYEYRSNLVRWSFYDTKTVRLFILENLLLTFFIFFLDQKLQFINP